MAALFAAPTASCFSVSSLPRAPVPHIRGMFPKGRHSPPGHTWTSPYQGSILVGSCTKTKTGTLKKQAILPRGEWEGWLNRAFPSLIKVLVPKLKQRLWAGIC